MGEEAQFTFSPSHKINFLAFLSFVYINKCDLVLEMMAKQHQGGHHVLDNISLNIAYTGTTLISLYRGDMWFHHIQK